MLFLPFGIATLYKEGAYYFLFLDPEIPNRLGWQRNQELIIYLNEKRDLLAQALTKESLKALSSNPENCCEEIFLRGPSSDEPKCYIPIPQKIIQEIKPGRAQLFALTGINNSQLLISKSPWKNHP